MNNMYRQGDLLLKRVKSIPTTARKIGDQILATGEATGHKHRLVGPAVILEEPAGQRFVKVSQLAQLVHEEHKPIDLVKGTYAVIHEREYDPFAEAMRPVLD